MTEPRRLALPEFVTIIALLFATLAFSIDAMLPALPQIAAELSPGAANRAQLVILAFMFGMGAGTIFTGPLSDAYGRKIVIVAGIGVYVLGAALAYRAASLEALLAARALQGLGAASPRIVPMAMVRDLYEGRRMAQLTSFIMTLFMLVPAVAPYLGTLIIDIAGWRAIFLAFILFGLTGVTWMTIRQPETLPPRSRRPLQAGVLADALRQVVTNRPVMLYTAVLSLGFTQMIGLLTSTQQIYADIFDRQETFPLWFALAALLAGTGTVLNAVLVMRLGMRWLAKTAYLVQMIYALAMLALHWAGLVPDNLAFAVYYVWSVSIFFMAGLTFGNLNALALQPLGHIAGMASSVIAAVSSIASVVLAIPIGQAFDGTLIPVLAATAICSTLAWAAMAFASEETAAEPGR